MKRSVASARVEVSQDLDEDDDMDIDIATSRVCLLPMLAAAGKTVSTFPDYSQTQEESQPPIPLAKVKQEPDRPYDTTPRETSPAASVYEPEVKVEQSPIRLRRTQLQPHSPQSRRRAPLGDRVNDEEDEATHGRNEKTQSSITDSPLSVPKGFVPDPNINSSFDESQMGTLPFAVREFFAALRDTERP